MKTNGYFWKYLNQCSAIGFICDNCGRSYSTKCNLQRHKRNECSGLKGFSCEICFKSFTRLHSVKYHKRVYHDSGWIMVLLFLIFMLSDAKSNIVILLLKIWHWKWRLANVFSNRFYKLCNSFFTGNTVFLTDLVWKRCSRTIFFKIHIKLLFICIFSLFNLSHVLSLYIPCKV